MQIFRQAGQTHFLNSVHVCVFYEDNLIAKCGNCRRPLFSSSLNLFLSLERGSWRNYDDGAESVHFFGMPFMHLGFNKGEREREGFTVKVREMPFSNVQDFKTGLPFLHTL